jgi:hypothetical protein
LTALGGIAGLDLFARTVPELVLGGQLLAIPVGAVVASRVVLGAQFVGWIPGWLLLGAAVFQAAPAIFPAQLLQWANGVPARVTLALGSVSVGVYLSAVLGTLQEFGASPVLPPVWVLPAVFVGLLVVVPLTRELPAWCPDVPALYR